VSEHSHGGRLAASALLLLALCGCQSSPTQTERREDKTRDAVARATEKLRPGIEWTARRFGAVIEVAAQEALAAAEGVIEGWSRSEHSQQLHPIDLNSASVAELRALPGITELQAQNIVRNRPYRSKQELMTKARLPEEAYLKIRDRVTTD
jgi:DNA uptake protein ComE-like DNA-binding protein